MALQDAIESGFIDLQNHNVTIENTDLILSGESIHRVLEWLKLNQKILIIFFDQFEDLFSKELLFPIFENFFRLAYEVDSLKSNLVLGFCWRTNTNGPFEHPAYGLWQGLADKRREFKLDKFSSQEASFLLNKLSGHLNQRLNAKLRERLKEESQCLPWLLKKLCIHVYGQIKNGASQNELLIQQFNAKSLFENDLEKLGDQEKICLEYIAKNSPADIFELTEKFGNLPDKIYSERRLLNKVGTNYTVYWDVFREYILSGTVPTMPWHYIPRTQVPTVLKIIESLQRKSSLSYDEAVKSFGYAPKTFDNILIDLQNFFLATRNQKSEINIKKGLENATEYEIADYISFQLKEHFLVREIYQNIAPGDYVTTDKIRDLFVDKYNVLHPQNEITKRSLETYINRIIQWLIFSGILESHPRYDALFIRPKGEGKQKGIRFYDSDSPDEQLDLLT